MLSEIVISQFIVLVVFFALKLIPVYISAGKEIDGLSGVKLLSLHSWTMIMIARDESTFRAEFLAKRGRFSYKIRILPFFIILKEIKKL